MDILILAVLSAASFILVPASAFSMQSSLFLAPSPVGSKISSSWSRTIDQHGRHGSTHSLIVMRDASASYWFQVGDSVRVMEDVQKAGVSLKGRVGTVCETWEKCDVDPTCCCAEQVDVGMAVRVLFQGTEEDTSNTEKSFYHYFAEDELTKETAPSAQQPMAFDGMSCVAFKKDLLQMDSRPRGIASYEPTRPEQDADYSTR